MSWAKALAELVVLDLADERRAPAEAGDADDGVGGRAAGNLHRLAHRAVDRLARAARRSAPCRPCASSAATRKSSSARAITSTMALPMPRTSYLRSGMKGTRFVKRRRTIAARPRAARKPRRSLSPGKAEGVKRRFRASGRASEDGRAGPEADFILQAFARVLYPSSSHRRPTQLGRTAARSLPGAQLTKPDVRAPHPAPPPISVTGASPVNALD